MTRATIAQLETDIRHLSLPEQLELLEYLARQIKSNTAASSFDADIAAMAADPAMQRELHAINAEFAVAELDGLEDL